MGLCTLEGSRYWLCERRRILWLVRASLHQDWTSHEKGMSSGGCRWLWYVDCFPSKYMYYPGLEGLLKIISVIICFGNVDGKTNFHCLCFYKFLPYCSFHFLNSSEAVLLELGEF